MKYTFLDTTALSNLFRPRPLTENEIALRAELQRLKRLQEEKQRYEFGQYLKAVRELQKAGVVKYQKSLQSGE